MKWFKLILSGLLCIGLGIALNTKLGQIPPLGKFLSPQAGVWQNEDSGMGDAIENLEGLSAPVEVFYDEALIPHVFAQNDQDLYRTQGYLTARHRLWQMEFQTHASAGRVSELIGTDGIEYDRGQRRKGMIFGAEKALETMKEVPGLEALLVAYRDGVNSYISQLEPADYPVEYKLLDYVPEPWTLKKTALLLMYMSDMLSGGDHDLEFTNFVKKYGKERFDLLYPDFYDVNDPVIPAERDWSDWEVEVPSVSEGDFPLDFTANTMDKPHPDNGSNNWAVGPGKSKTGNAILANDPHLGLNLPSIWFAMQLATPEKNTFGVTLPGAAGIVIGFNNHISWGVTNATRDVKDWYKIKFQDDKREAYWHDEQWKPTTKKIEEIVIRGGEVYYDTVVYTHHGPVSYDHSFKGNEQQSGYAMQWTGHLGGNNQQAFLELNAAKNYDEYEAALQYFVAPAQNFIFSSTEGDIALWIQGKFPNKWKGQGKFLMDGTNPEHDWQGFIPQQHNAHVKNPERGFVSSSNQHPTDPSYPYYVFNDGYDTYRNRVINDFFRSKEKFGVQDFQDLHNNNYNLKAAELLPHLLEQIDRTGISADEIDVLNELSQWDFYNDLDKVGATMFERWWTRLRVMVWDELSSDSLELDFPFTYQTVYMLKNHPDNEFMDIVETDEVETAPDLILKSFKEAMEDLETIESRRGNLKWGDYKGTFVAHLLPGVSAFGRYNLPIGGNGGIVNATSRNHGPSWRMIVEMSSPPKAYAVYPGGQSGNPGSKYYDNMVDTWAAGNYMDIQFMQKASDSEKMIFIQTINPKP